MVGRGVCWGLGLVSMVAASVAHAQEAPEGAEVQEPQTGREALVLTLQGSLVDYQKQTVKADKPSGSSVDPEEQKTSNTSYGPLGAGLGFGIGYTWDQVLLGVRAELTNSDTSLPGGSDVSLTQVSFLPRLEYMFSTDTARPFVAGIVGIQHTSASNTFDGSGSSKLEDSSTRFAIGGAFGLHAFANRSVSIDPELTALYSSGSGTLKSSSSQNPDRSQDYSISNVRVLFSLSLSGWIDTGGAPTPLPPASEHEAPAAASAPPIASDEQEAKPVSADIRLPKHRKLYLQVSKDPQRPSALMRLTESRSESALLQCDDVAIFESGGPLKLAVRSHGPHYLTGRIPLHALEVLASNADATISVCAEQWQLGQESREAVQSFLNARRELLEENGDSEAPAAPAPAPAPAPEPAPAPAPDATTTPAPPATGSFPTGTEAASPAGTVGPAPTKTLKPKK